MARHQYKNVSFEPPPDWIDKTIVAFAAPAPAGAKNAPNVVMTQEPLREADTLRTHADRQLMELAKQLHDFDILESRETTVGGQPAIFMRYTWKAHFGALEQSSTLAVVDKMVINFTTTSRAEDAPKVRAAFAEMLGTVRFGGDEVPPYSMPPQSLPMPSSPGHEPPAPVVPMPGFRGNRR